MILPNAFTLKDKLKTKISFSRAFDNLNLKKKKTTFKKFLLLFLFFGIANGLISGYIFPVFLKSKGFSVDTIGILLGLQVLSNGISVFLFRKETNLRKLIIFGGFLYLIFLVPLGFSSSVWIGILMLLFGISLGVTAAGTEIILTKITNVKSYAGDIGLLFLGYHFIRSATVALSGFLIANLGFGIVFLISAIIFMIYSIFASLQF